MSVAGCLPCESFLGRFSPVFSLLPRPLSCRCCVLCVFRYCYSGGGGGAGWFGGGGGVVGGGGGGSSFSLASKATSVTHSQGVQAGHGVVELSYPPPPPSSQPSSGPSMVPTAGKNSNNDTNNNTETNNQQNSKAAA